MSVVRLDNVISNAVDSLGPTIKRLSNKVGLDSDGVSKTGSVKNVDGKETDERRMPKDGNIPQESAKRFWSLLPAAALPFLEYARNGLNSKICTDKRPFLPKIQVFEKHFGGYLLTFYTLLFLEISKTGIILSHSCQKHFSSLFAPVIELHMTAVLNIFRPSRVVVWFNW